MQYGRDVGLGPPGPFPGLMALHRQCSSQPVLLKPYCRSLFRGYCPGVWWGGGRDWELLGQSFWSRAHHKGPCLEEVCRRCPKCPCALPRSAALCCWHGTSCPLMAWLLAQPSSHHRPYFLQVPLPAGILLVVLGWERVIPTWAESEIGDKEREALPRLLS